MIESQKRVSAQFVPNKIGCRSRCGGRDGDQFKRNHRNEQSRLHIPPNLIMQEAITNLFGTEEKNVDCDGFSNSIVQVNRVGSQLSKLPKEKWNAPCIELISISFCRK